MVLPGAAAAVPAPGDGSTDRTRRLDVWRDVVRDHFVALDIRADPDGFAGSVCNTRLGHLDVATVESTSQLCRRSPALARRDPRVYLQVGLLTQGAATLTQDGREARLGPGCYAVYETDRPFTWDLHGPWQLHVFTWDRAAIPLSPAHTQRLTARALDGARGLTGLVGRMLRELGDAPPEVSAAGGLRLSGELGELVTTVAGEALAADLPAAAADLLRRVDRYIAEHLTDPDLGPATIARDHHVSTRSLHRLFAGSGSTVAERIRQQRLDRCRRDLADPALRAVPVAEIGRRWGFCDPGSFSRAFRTAYRTTPTAHRAAHLGWVEAAGAGNLRAQPPLR